MGTIVKPSLGAIHQGIIGDRNAARKIVPPFPIPQRAYGGLFSGVDPRTITGMALWLDASDGTTITVGTGASQWNDKSGNANNATQATGSAQPTVQSKALNNLNTLLFTRASSQYMQLASPLSGTTFTVFAVARAASASSNALETIGSTHTVDADGAILEWNANSTTVTGVYARSTAGYWGDDTGNAGDPHDTASYHRLHCFSTNDNTTTAYFDGVLQSTGSWHASVIAPVWQWIGRSCSFYSDAYIAEIMVYSGILAANQAAILSDYQSRKWGIV